MSAARGSPVIAALVALALEACGDSASTSEAGGGAGGEGGGSSAGGHYQGGAAVDPNAVVGTFEIELPAATEDGIPSIVGKVYDGPTPQTLVWEASTEDGDCRLFTPRVPYCPDPCGGDAACVEDETCQPYPTARSVGAVTLSGVNTESGEPITLTPVANGYQSVSDMLVEPPFAGGDEIALAAEGGYFAPFSISARGIAALSFPNESLALSAGTGLALTWDPAESSESRIHIKVDLSHHGGTKGKIECDVADDGAAEISAALVDELMGLGLAGFPTIVIARRQVGATDIEVGTVELVIASSVEIPIDIDGLISCTDDTQCPDDETCQTDLTCQ